MGGYNNNSQYYAVGVNNVKSVNKYVLTITVALALLAGGCSSKEISDDKQSTKKTEPVQVSEFEIRKAPPQRIDQIYGLGYPGNDEGLYIASHQGIKIHSGDGWLEGTSQKHEYLGFQATKDGFFASGHPEEGSDLKNPLGLVKSIDKGATLEKLAFYGESDFHFLSSSYGTDTLYVINEKETPTLKLGVYLSEDEGQTWEPVKLNGFDSDTFGMIAVHPTNSNMMAMATKSGIFLSEDKGKNIKRVTEPIMATALTFSENNLYYSSVENNKVLFNKLNINTLESEQMEIPFLDYDNPVTYIAVNHKDNKTLSFSTYLYDVYESNDEGENWNLILKNGKIE